MLHQDRPLRTPFIDTTDRSSGSARPLSRQTTLRPRPERLSPGVDVIVISGRHQGKVGRLAEHQRGSGWWMEVSGSGQLMIEEGELTFNPAVYTTT